MSTVTNLQEEINFIKSKASAYLKQLSEIHKKEKDKLREQISDLEERLKHSNDMVDETPTHVRNPSHDPNENESLKQKISDYEKQISYLNQSFSNQNVDSSLAEKYKEHASKLKSELDKTLAERNKLQRENDAIRKVRQKLNFILFQ